MSFCDLALSRRSIRKWTEAKIPQHDLDTMLHAAMTAPSACGCQNWHFVVLNSKQSIDGLADAVEKGVIHSMHELGLTEESFISNRVKHASFFRNAPLVICVYMEPMTYYEPRITQAMQDKNMDYDAQMQAIGQPDLLGVAAAIENLLLCAQDLGYGGCWMNDPLRAVQEIDAHLQQSAPRKLVSLVPIGVPAYTPREKVLRDAVIEYR